MDEEPSVYAFPKDPSAKEIVNQRKGISRSLIKRMLISKKFTYEQIAAHAGCTARHVRRIRDELIEAGEMTKDEGKKGIGIVAAEFDEECIQSVGESFKVYIQNKRKNWKTPFNFTRRTWQHVWNEPSIFLMLDRADPTGAECAQKFIETFKNDTKRIRDHKKWIRPFFVFIGRDDLNNKYMTMSKTRDPEGVREVPQIEFITFPLKFDEALTAYEERHGIHEATKLKWKVTSGLRTGLKSEERGWSGVKTVTDSKSYITFVDGPDQFVCSVLEKMNEKWRITWIPTSIRNILYEIYSETPDGQTLLNCTPEAIRKRWYEVSEPILGFRLELHDFRKVFATWLILLGVPFNKAAKLNVGWADLNTLDRNYNQVNNAMKQSDIEKYRKNIPGWFKEDLADYVPELNKQ